MDSARPPTQYGQLDTTGCKVVLSIAEFRQVTENQRKGDPRCEHQWGFRAPLDMDKMLVLAPGELAFTNFPPGKVCSKCGAICLGPHDQPGTEWGQNDFQIVKH